MNRLAKNLSFDAFLVIGSILAAVILVQTGAIDHAIIAMKRFSVFGVFIAGMFFTSVFTTAPAIAALGELSLSFHPVVVALIGGAGAIVGDLVIFKFIKDRFSADIGELLKGKTAGERIEKMARLKFFRWFFFFIGGIVLASPLPDELGITLLSASSLRTSWFLVVAFVFNSLGILTIALIARTAAL